MTRCNLDAEYRRRRLAAREAGESFMSYGAAQARLRTANRWRGGREGGSRFDSECVPINRQ
jgi:hypothetical protein